MMDSKQEKQVRFVSRLLSPLRRLPSEWLIALLALILWAAHGFRKPEETKK